MKTITSIMYVIKLFSCKKSLIIFSFLSSFSFVSIMDIINEHLSNKDKMFVLFSVCCFMFLSSIFFICDLVTGIIASIYEGNKIKSSKWETTISKFFGLFLYSFISITILTLLSHNYIVISIIFGIYILTILKEYISIGENIERRIGKKPYMFNVVDKVFKILEKKFFNKLKNEKNKK